MRYVTFLFTSMFLNFIANAQVAINITGALPASSSNYSGFGVIAIKAIQEQQKQIEDVKKRIWI